MADNFFGSNMFDQDPWKRRGEDVAAIASVALPVGVPVPWPTATAPSGWVICDGAAVPAGCPQLTAIYGANLPNLKGRVIAGYDAAQAEFNTLLATGGSKNASVVTHNHTQDSHGHTQDAHNHTQDPHHHAAAANQFVITHNADPYRVGDSVGGTFQQVTFTTNDANTTATNQATTATDQGTTATNQAAGSSGTGANLAPYEVFNYIVRKA